MRYFQWILLFPINIIFSILCIITSPIASLFVSTDRTHLQFPFQWLNTIDNDLGGDSGWKEEHLIGSDPYSYINRTRWLIRNGGNWVSYYLFGCRETPYRQSGYFYENMEGYWLLRKPIWITKTRFIDLFIGWNLPGAKFGRAKFTSSFRLKTKL